MTRRKFYGTMFGAFAMAAPYPCYFEPRWLDVTEKRVRLNGAGLEKPVRLLHLSDLHASLPVPLSMINHAVTRGLELKPDLICLTGDYITNRGGFHFSSYAGILERLSAAAPTFAVLGNHDGGPWVRHHLGYANHNVVENLLREGGVELLHNRNKPVRVHDQEIQLVGVGDLWNDEVEGRCAFVGVDGSVPTVLLAHNPDTKDEVEHLPWHLMLSGHTHGGQVIVFDNTRYIPVEDKRYVSGLKPWGTRQIHVTRGIGNVGGVRFRCRPEVSMLVVS
jgi:predicted MPP superfamily phosphohydrolase